MLIKELEKKITTNNLICFFIILSMIICTWIQYIQYGKINIDSVLYFESAKLIANGDWLGSIKIYNWPFYSACIAFTHKLTNLNIEHSAQLLNVIFFGISTASFLNIISLAGGKKLEIIFGALILFSSRHIVGSMLAMPMRDEGFWAFFLLAIFFFIRFIQLHHIRDTLFWQLSILIAMLFRIEGVSYLILLPTIIFFIDPNMKKWQAFLKSYLVFFILTLFLLLFNSYSILGVSRLHEILPSTLFLDFTSQLLAKSQLLSSVVLGKYLGEYAVESLLVSFFVIIIIKTVSTIGIINSGLAIGTIFQRKKIIDLRVYYILLTVGSISILNLMFISIKSFVIVGRYTAALSFILLIFATFSICAFIDVNSKYKIIKRISLTFLALFIVLNIGKNLQPDSNKTYHVKEAVTWLKSKNRLNKSVFYDSILSRYYANEPYTTLAGSNKRIDFLNNEQIDLEELMQHHYLVINISEMSKKNLDFIISKFKQYKVIKIFEDFKGENATIIFEKF